MKAFNWFVSVTEDARSWLASKLFPEYRWYADALGQIGEIRENRRIIEILRESNYVPESLIESIEFKTVSFDEVIRLMEEQEAAEADA